MIQILICAGDSSLICYGDSGAHIKVMDWRKGILRKLPNHVENIGFTDCVQHSGDILAASYYDIDTGSGGINIFNDNKDEDPEYLVSLTDEETSRVLSLDIQSDPEGNILMISGGRELKMWKRCLDTNNRGEDDVVVRARVGHMFTDGGLTTGASESEMSEDEMISSFNEANNRTAVLEKKSGFCNCSLM